MYFNYFSTSVQYIYIYILLTRLLMELYCRYIVESLKRIIANATNKISMELFHRYSPES